MMFTTQRDKLLGAVQVAERIVGKKESLPVLSCVLLSVGNGTCTVSSTNLESAAEISVPGEVGESGTIAVSATILSQTLRSIMTDKVTLTTKGDNLHIEARGSKTLIKATPHDEFPTLPPVDKGVSGITLPTDMLLKGIQSVSYAASASMIRPELGSMYIALSRGSITFAATDSFRLAEKIIMNSSIKEDDIEILIPLKHTIELQHVLEKASESVSIILGEAHMTVISDGITFVSRVVDAAFPNYKEIIPKKFTTEATLLKTDFAETMRKARVFAGSEQHVGLHVYPKKKIFTATARSNDIGEMSDSLEASLSGEDIDINFHIDYLSDCMQSIDADSITIGFSGPGKALVVRGASDQGFTYLVMPLNR